MALETKVKVGGAWKLLTEPKVKVGGFWKVVDKIEVKVAGVGWKTVFELGGDVPFVSNIVVQNTVAGSGNVAFSGCHFEGSPAGIINERRGGETLLGTDFDGNDHTGEWADFGPTGSLWEIACLSMVAGIWSDVGVSPAAPLGVYIDLSLERVWYVRRQGGKGWSTGTTTATGNFRIREKADTANLVNFTMKATAIQTV